MPESLNKKEDFAAIKKFISNNFRHFNSCAVKDASEAYVRHLNSGGKMFLSMAGAMSTAELGITLAEMIRQNKIHAICCTAANLEEDLFNLVAHDHYKLVPNYRYFTKKDEQNLLERHLNRVTDTCIPEEEAMRRLEKQMIKVWKRADDKKQRFFPYEYIYQTIREGLLKQFYQIDPKNSWVVAACEKNIPIWTPGWEDSTLGNIFVALTRGRGKNYYGENINLQLNSLISGAQGYRFMPNFENLFENAKNITFYLKDADVGKCYGFRATMQSECPRFKGGPAHHIKFKTKKTNGFDKINPAKTEKLERRLAY